MEEKKKESLVANTIISAARSYQSDIMDAETVFTNSSVYVLDLRVYFCHPA